MDPLQKAKENNRKAPEEVLKALKVAIADKLLTAYKAYRENNPEVEKRTPWRTVYCDIYKQVNFQFSQKWLNRYYRSAGIEALNFFAFFPAL